MLYTRVCRSCGREKLATLEFFFQDYSVNCSQDNPYGVGNYCKTCSKLASQQRRYARLHTPQRMEKARQYQVAYRRRKKDEYSTKDV